MSNIISSVVFGHRFEYSDPSFRQVLELDNEAVILAGSLRTQVFFSIHWKETLSSFVSNWSQSVSLQQLFDVFPGLMKHLPGPHQTVHTNYRKILTFLKKQIEKHREEWNPEDPRDYIDVYLSEMEKVNHSHNMRLLSISSVKTLIVSLYNWYVQYYTGRKGDFEVGGSPTNIWWKKTFLQVLHSW